MILWMILSRTNVETVAKYAKRRQNLQKLHWKNKLVQCHKSLNKKTPTEKPTLKAKTVGFHFSLWLFRFVFSDDVTRNKPASDRKQSARVSKFQTQTILTPAVMVEKNDEVEHENTDQKSRTEIPDLPQGKRGVFQSIFCFSIQQ